MKITIILIRKKDGLEKEHTFNSRKHMSIFLRNNWHIYTWKNLKTN